MAVVTVKNIGKKYQQLTHQDQFPTLRDRLLPGGRRKSYDFWALQDINFSLEKGQVLGVVGHNGAGKSTLFKIISHVTRPTTGEVVLRGRVSSMLEVGTGFHPELSGRENIFLNGAILGMKRKEIETHFDEIVEFAEVANFLDDPVKYYSSGMYARLAFAIASFLTSEIMIIDEVLSVGDGQFQRKCQQKIKELVRDQGRTVLIVSHNIARVEELADRCLWLDHGRIKMYAPTKKVLPAYRKAMQIPDNKCK
ncbi:ABC transporter ATP-binding protein [bacterium]|nr:ABC transporter ATP-binding protein [bacterium]MBQ6436513.1 ABC transporter ATP-binding protein [bacterium]